MRGRAQQEPTTAHDNPLRSGQLLKGRAGQGAGEGPAACAARCALSHLLCCVHHGVS